MTTDDRSVGRASEANRPAEDDKKGPASDSRMQVPERAAEDQIALERKYAIKLADARQAAFRLSETAAERERALTARLQDSQQVALQMSRMADERLQRLSKAHENSITLAATAAAEARETSARLQKAYEVIVENSRQSLKLSQSMAARDRELTSELQAVQDKLLALTTAAAEEAREMKARLESANEAIENGSRGLSESERELETVRSRLAHSNQLIDYMRRALSEMCESLQAGDDSKASAVSPASRAGIGGLLTLRGSNFIEGAYRIVLNRDSDVGGREHYLEEMRNGVSKVEILRRLRYSPEGRTVAGDRPSPAAAFLYRTPLVGRWLESVVDAARVFTNRRRRRAFEHAIAEDLEQANAAELEKKSKLLLSLQQLIASTESSQPTDRP